MTHSLRLSPYSADSALSVDTINQRNFGISYFALEKRYDPIATRTVLC